MRLKLMLAAAGAAAAIVISGASAQTYGPPQGREQSNPYAQRDPNSQSDQNAYYDRNQHMGGQFDQRQVRGNGPGQSGNSGGYYQQGAYEQN